jgi:hypothetical protein
MNSSYHSIMSELLAVANKSRSYERYDAIVGGLAKQVDAVRKVCTLPSAMQNCLGGRSYSLVQGDDANITVALDALAAGKRPDPEGQCVPMTAITTLVSLQLGLDVQVNDYPHHTSATISEKGIDHEIDLVVPPFARPSHGKPLSPIAIASMAWGNKGDQYVSSNDDVRAEACFNRANEVFPLPNTYLHLGNLYERRGDLHDAAAHYNKAIALDPELAESYIELARVTHKLGDADAALHGLKSALQKKRKNDIDTQRARSLRREIFKAERRSGRLLLDYALGWT